MKQDRRILMIDGKPVRCWLFARQTRVAYPGLLEVDRTGGSLVLVSVEAFTLDHAVARLVELYPFAPKSDWDMLEELDPEHDIGTMGAHHALLPVVQGSRRLQ